MKGCWELDAHISRYLIVNVLHSYVSPAYMNALETMVFTEKQQEKVQVCENKLVRRIVGDFSLLILVAWGMVNQNQEGAR